MVRMPSVWIIVLPSALAAASCTADGTARQHQSRVVQGEWPAVFAAAEATLREYFHIEESNPRAGVIRSSPTEEPYSEPPRLLGAAISSPRQQRRIAEIRVRPHGGSVQVECGVKIQRSDMVSKLAYPRRESVDDVPNQTPLQETQGRADGGQVVWSTTAQDHRLEREILAGIEARLAGGTD